jgi:uncharacterized membrane protein
MKKFSFVDLVTLIIGLLPIGYLIYMYPTMPAIVPTHFGINGKPDSFDPKSQLVIIECVLIGISFLVYLLMKFMSAIDPKRYAEFNQSRYNKLGVVIVIFCAIIAVVITCGASQKSFNVGNVIFALAGLLFIFMGNLMYNIKPSYFVGIRTPWTLESPDNWRATHHLAGKLFVAGGIIITIAKLVLPMPLGIYIVFIGLGVMVLVPITYSYIYFKKHQVK